ncbi:MAG: sulfur carrier protein ThiS adenylyltransferase ThiF [Bacilli bacterium]
MKLKINGKPYFTKTKQLLSLRDNLGYSKDVVMIINGYQSNYDKILQDCDEIFFINKGEMVEENVLELMMSSRHTPNIHSKLKDAKVAIAGLGGLGSAIAIMLARTGVGTLLLVDYDIVEPSNLNRQNYFITDLGKLKTEALKNQIKNINPFINIELKNEKVNVDNILDIFKDYKIVCEAFDSPNTKAMLINELLSFGDIYVIAASGMAGYYSSNKITTKHIFDNLYVCGDGVNSAKEGVGLMAPRVNICAAHQANMIIRLILGIKE